MKRNWIGTKPKYGFKAHLSKEGGDIVMAEFDIDLNEVAYKPPLKPDDYTFAVIKASFEQAKEPNKNSGQREWMIRTELKPLEAPDYTVFHIWSLSTNAIAVEDAVVSIKKMYEVMGVSVGSKVSTDDILTFRFVAHTKLEPFNGRLNPKLEKILKPAV